MFLFLIINFIELYEFEEDGFKNIYWSVNYPWPMSNRDVSFNILHCDACKSQTISIL